MSLFIPDGSIGIYKGAPQLIELIREMTSEMKTSKIQVEIDHFLVYRKSKVGLFIGSLVEPLLSDGQVFLNAGETCKIKIKIESVDFTKLPNVKNLEFLVKNSCEEKNYSGTFVKQFTATSITDYVFEKQKTLSF